MDAYQQHHRFMRPPPSPQPPPPPPPPAGADPYHHHHYQQQQIPARPPPGPPQGHNNWYSSQFQFSPSPPPPMQQQWGPPQPPPPPGSYHAPPTPPAQQHSYHAPPSVHQNHQLPPPPAHAPRPPPPPPPPPHSHFPPQPYAQSNQEWGTQNWAHHQGSDFQAHSNEEDWAARARAWADANKALEHQHPQSQFTPAGRVDEQNYYHQQYTNAADSYYTEVQHQPLPAASYQQAPVSTAPLHQPPTNHPSDFAPISSDSSFYAPEGPLHTVRDGNSAPDSNSMIQHQGNLPKSPSVHQQEVPSSYSSVTAVLAGNDGGMLPLSNSASQEGLHHVPPPLAMPLADQPLEFATRFNRDDPNMKSSYPYVDPAGPIRGMDTLAAIPSMNNWTASMPYAPIPPVLPPGSQQHDPAVAMQPPVPGPPLPPFSSFPGSGLHPAIPSAGSPFALALHPNTAFSGDAYGIPSLSERPKKAAVPNWLKEEIKKKVIAGSSMDQPKEDPQSLEDKIVDRSIGNGDQEDSKSIDSSRSAEDDEDDEDYVDAAKSAAINQEIKRVLTEVLLKVTDELFDEIATKVLNEDNPTNEDGKSKVSSNHKASLSAPTVPTPKAAAELLIAGKSRESETERNTENPSSISHGVLLGLANYATDDDDDEDETEDLSSPNSAKKDVPTKLTSEERQDVNANGSSLVQSTGISRNLSGLESGSGKASSVEFKLSNTDAVTDFSYDKNTKNASNSGSTADNTIPLRSKDSGDMDRFEPPEDDHSVMKSSRDNKQVKETKVKPDKSDRHESKKNSGRDVHEDEESSKRRTEEKGNGKHRRHDERHSRRDKTEELNSSKDRRKEEKVHESEPKKRSSHVNEEDKEDKKETERHHRAGAKEESSRKREHRDKDDDRSRHKRPSDSSRHKKRRSSSVTRGRSNKEISARRDDDTSDDASDDSKRKRHSRRRNLSRSPSPSKSRRRQVSRSPISKHSQRKHSPYSSLDTNRGKRSRSRSPVQRHR